MTRRTVFCVQTYRRRGAAMEPADLRSYGTQHEALQASREVSPRMAMVTVYEVEVDPESDLVGDPRRVAEYRDGKARRLAS